MDKNTVIDSLVNEAMKSAFFPYDIEGALIVAEYRIKKHTGFVLHEHVSSWNQYQAIMKEVTERLKKRSG